MTAGATTRRAAHDGRVASERFRDFVARTAFTPFSRAPAQLLGAEIEFVAVREDSGRVAPLDGARGASVLGAVRAAARARAWREGRSEKGVAWFQLPAGGRVTFEPGGQVEYAAPPRHSATALIDDLSETAGTLREACAGCGIRLLDCGLDPANALRDAPLQADVPRYRAMNAYFERIGPAGARMMRQSASLQLAVDIGDASGARWRLLNALAPVLTGLFANSRRYAGSATAFASYRAETWRRADPLRTGVLEGLDPVAEYVEFALGAPAMFLGAGGEPARPFSSWLTATGPSQWDKHLGTLFPEVRPRGYFEIRSIDAVPQTLWPAAIAFVAGLVYDSRAAQAAAEILRAPDTDRLFRAGHFGLADPWLNRAARDLADLAVQSCQRLGSRFLAEHHLAAAADSLRALTH